MKISTRVQLMEVRSNREKYFQIFPFISPLRTSLEKRGKRYSGRFILFYSGQSDNVLCNAQSYHLSPHITRCLLTRATHGLGLCAAVPCRYTSTQE